MIFKLDLQNTISISNGDWCETQFRKIILLHVITRVQNESFQEGTREGWVNFHSEFGKDATVSAKSLVTLSSHSDVTLSIRHTCHRIFNKNIYACHFYETDRISLQIR